MSVANQANEKLTQLVALASKIEGYLNPAKQGEGKGKEKEGKGKEGASAPTGLSGADISKEAKELTGLSTALTELIKVSEKSKGGDKLAKFISSMASSIKEAADSIKDVDVKGWANVINAITGGIAKFALGLILFALAAPLIALGALTFTLVVMGMVWAFGKLTAVNKEVLDGISTIMSMGRGIALFALAMTAIAIVAPLFAFGVVVFTLAISAMMITFSLLRAAKKGVLDGLQLIMKMSVDIAVFALAMTLLGIPMVAKLFATGVIVFTLAISFMMTAFSLLSGMKKVVRDGLQLILKMSTDIAIFALTMTLLGIPMVAKLFATGVIVFTLGISFLMTVFSLLKGMKKTVRDGLQLILSMSKDIFIFSLTMVGVGIVAPLFALGVIVFTLGISLLMGAMAILGKFDKDINKGSKAMFNLAKPAAIMTAILAVAGLIGMPIAIGGIVLGIGMLAVGLAAYALGKFDKDIKKGSTVLMPLATSLVVFSAAMFILAAAPDTPMNLLLKMGVIAASIVALGLAAYALGLPLVYPFAIAGAGVLVVLAAGLLIFSTALLVLSLVKIKPKDASNIGESILTLGTAIAGLGPMSVFILLGALVLTPMAVGLLFLTPALAIFKEIKWKKKDGESLKNAVQSVVQAFTGAFEGIGFMEMLKLMAVIPLVGKIGVSLTSLAQGVKAMATMTFIEQEYDEKTGKLVPKREVRLTDQEIQQVGPNVAAILNALAQPLTEFGMWSTKGETGFGPFTLGAGYMEKGIDAAVKVGRMLVDLGTGVADMANLQVVEYEVVGAGTVDAKLVPKRTRQLSPLDFAMAAINTSIILGAIAKPLVEFGKQTEDGSGWFSDGYLMKGIEAASKVSRFLVDLGTGVANMANLEVTNYEIVGAGTPDAKLVPSSTRKLTPLDFLMAALNVDLILGAIAKPLIDFGKATEEGSGWFSSGYLDKGIEALGKLTEPLGVLADTILKMAGGQAVINKVVDDGKGGTKLVPDRTISFAAAIPKAIAGTKKLLDVFPKIFVDFGKFFEKNEESLEIAFDRLGDINKGLGTVASMAENFLKVVTKLDEADQAKTKSMAPFLANVGTSLTVAGIWLKDLGESDVFDILGDVNDVFEFMPKMAQNYVDTLLNLDKGAKAQSKTIYPLLYDISMSFGKNDIAMLSDVSDFEDAGKAMNTLIGTSDTYIKILRNLDIAATTQTKVVAPFMKDLALGLKYVGGSAGSLSRESITNLDKTTSIIERLSKIVSPFERFTKAFSTFSKDMGIFVKNWKPFSEADAINFTKWAAASEKVAKVPNDKLKTNLDAINKYTEEQMNASGGLLGKLVTMFGGSNEDANGVKTAADGPPKNTPTPQKNQGQGNQGGNVGSMQVGSLTVSSLTITGDITASRIVEK